MSRRARRRLDAVLFATIVFGLCFGTAWAATAGAKVHWHTAGASVFGSPCDPGEIYGDHDNRLADTPLGFAELGMGTYLGGLRFMAKIRAT